MAKNQTSSPVRQATTFRTLRRWLRGDTVIAAVAGALFSIGLQAIFTDVLPWDSGVVAIAVAILVFFTIGYMSKTASRVEEHVRLTSIAAYNEEQIAEYHGKISGLVRDVQNSIVVLSADLQSVPTYLPEGRAGYLRTVEATIQEKLGKARDDPFSYTRVLQSTRIPFDETLKLDQVDEETFRHCQKVFGMTKHPKSHERLDFQLYIREPVGNCPSILVVDDQHVALSILGVHFEDPSTKKQYHQGMVILEDHSGAAARHYKAVIEKLTKGKEVQHIEACEG